MTGYNFKKVRDTLKQYGMDLQIDLEKGRGLLRYEENEAPVMVTRSGSIPLLGFEEMFSYIEKWRGKEESQKIARKVEDAKQKSNLESRTANYVSIFFAIVLIGLTFTRAGITGNVISETANSRIDFAVIICLVGLIGGMVWRRRLKRK